MKAKWKTACKDFEIIKCLKCEVSVLLQLLDQGNRHFFMALRNSAVWLLSEFTQPRQTRNTALAAVQCVAGGFLRLVSQPPLAGVWRETMSPNNPPAAMCRKLKRSTNPERKWLTYCSTSLDKKIAMKQKHHSAGRRERKFRARQKVLKEIKILVCSEKNSPKTLLVTLMLPRPLQWFPCWLALWRSLPAHDTANPTVSHIITVLDERKESFLTDPDAEQGRTILGSSATWAEGVWCSMLREGSSATNQGQANCSLLSVQALMPGLLQSPPPLRSLNVVPSKGPHVKWAQLSSRKVHESVTHYDTSRLNQLHTTIQAIWVGYTLQHKQTHLL